MTDNDPVHALVRLEKGFRTDSARLKTLEGDLAETLQCARHFGGSHGSPGDWNTDWNRQWDSVEALLRRIRVLVDDMDGSIASGDDDRLKSALETWDTIESEDGKLVEALGGLRAQAGGLDAAARKDWNLLARTIESNLETIHACAQALRIKLELLKKYSRDEVDRLVQDILIQLPNRTQADGINPAAYEREYRAAASELAQERHKFMGFMDVVKGLWMWVETPAERVRKNRSLQVDQD